MTSRLVEVWLLSFEIWLLSFKIWLLFFKRYLLLACVLRHSSPPSLYAADNEIPQDGTQQPANKFRHGKLPAAVLSRKKRDRCSLSNRSVRLLVSQLVSQYARHDFAYSLLWAFQAMPGSVENLARSFMKWSRLRKVMLYKGVRGQCGRLRIARYEA